jgi:hypothetical protein
VDAGVGFGVIRMRDRCLEFCERVR